MSFKEINELVMHLKNVHNVEFDQENINDLLNMGYYHGYKGYRFIKTITNVVNYTNFKEVVAIYDFDSDLKALFYKRIMFIETAIKNRILNTLSKYKYADFDSILKNLMKDHERYNQGNAKSKKKYKQSIMKKLELNDSMNRTIAYNYRNDKTLIQHYIHKGEAVPIWALFEVLSFGDIGNFVQCLNLDIRKEIAESLGVHSTSLNQNGRIVEDIIFTLKDLRNAVAHNGVIYDCRFKGSNPAKILRAYLEYETSISNINFGVITDYLILTTVLVNKLSTNKSDLGLMYSEFWEMSVKLRDEVNMSIYYSILNSDNITQIRGIGEYIKANRNS